MVKAFLLRGKSVAVLRKPAEEARVGDLIVGSTASSSRVKVLDPLA